MLGKLLKYEFKATGRTLFPLYCVLLAFAVIIKLFLLGGYSNQPPSDNFKGILFVISILGYGFSMAAIFVVTFFIIIQRFYKNLLGDEGYLMHTLPVAPWQNIMSKLLAAMAWTIVSGIVALLTIFIFSLGTIPYLEILALLPDSLIRVIDETGVKIFLFIIEGILIVLSQMALSFTLIYASISLGHLFNKRKILASFAAFIGLNIIMNTIIGFGSTVLSFINIRNIDINLSSNDPNVILSMLNTGLLVGILVNLLFFAGYFAITNYVVKNKLNLE